MKGAETGVAGVKRSKVKRVWVRVVLERVRHVMPRMGDVAFPEFASCESTML